VIGRLQGQTVPGDREKKVFHAQTSLMFQTIWKNEMNDKRKSTLLNYCAY
jgi:catabolite regulation protein CreA